MDYHGLAGKVKDFKTRPFHPAHLLGRMLIAVVSLLLAGQFTPFSTRLSTVLVGIRPTYHAEIFKGREGMEQATAGDQKGQSLVEYGFTLLLVTLVVILMVKAFGQTTNNTYSTISSSVKNAMGG